MGNMGPSDGTVAVNETLVRELVRLRDAGNELAAAAHRVSTTYDGVHRLRLALAGWYQALADEFDRDRDIATPSEGAAGMSTYPGTTPQGYTCALCHAWISNGSFHSCSDVRTSTPFVSPAAPWYTACDHCLCVVVPDDDLNKGEHYTVTRTVPHNQCCHCGRQYAVARGGPVKEGE